ncbi:hypothetical protein N7530_002411 [Penicillium desertorum]|uniref:Uncharacterized protein n=1 Tax=Penicillium desertorum TaxID=1303715 RepID=A0A9W9X3Z7_9EURO|nr:hypothetical protein N7530_002411 [Penicillium desertorum]
MDENLRQHYLGKVADLCNCLAAGKGDTISGVDGRQLLERYLLKGNSKMADPCSTTAPGELYNSRRKRGSRSRSRTEK